MDQIDLVQVLGGLVSVIIIAGAFVVKSILTQLDNAHRRISKNELSVAKFYVQKVDLAALEARIISLLTRIETKLDKKVDK